MKRKQLTLGEGLYVPPHLGQISRGVPDPYPGYSVVDLMVDANGTNLTAQTPDKAPVGEGWEIAGGSTFTINNNYVAGDVNASDNEAHIETGFVNQDISVIMNMPAGGIGVLEGRWTDVENNVILVIFNNTNFITLYQDLLNVNSQLGSDTLVFEDDTDYLVRMTIDSSHFVRCYVDGVEKLGATTGVETGTEVALEDATGHGKYKELYVADFS